MSRCEAVIAYQCSPEWIDSIRHDVPPGVEFLAASPDAPWLLPERAEALIAMPRGAARLAPHTPQPKGWPGNLEWVHFFSTGVDKYPSWLFRVSTVTVSRGAQSEAIAEYVLTAMLVFEKRVPEIWVSGPEAWKDAKLGGLTGRTLGLIGFGHIGREVARRASAFDMEILIHRRTRGHSGIPGVRAASFREVLGASEHLVICAPLTDETSGLFDREAFAECRKGVHLINIARGAIIQTDALRAALDDGTVAMASLDVCDPEPPPEGHWLFSHPRVRLTAHISFSAPISGQRIQEIALRNIAAWMAGERQNMHGLVQPGRGY